MGILDTIKQTYKKVDTSLGGYLPGGQTPSQVSTAKTPISIPSSQQIINDAGYGNAKTAGEAIRAVDYSSTPSANVSIPTISGGRSRNSGIPSGPEQNFTPAPVSAPVSTPPPNTSTVNGPVYSAPSQSSPRQSSSPQVFNDRGAPVYQGDNPFVKGLDTALNFGAQFANIPKFDPVTGRSIEQANQASIALPGAGVVANVAQNAAKELSVDAAEKLAASNTAKIGAQKIIQPFEEKGTRILAGETVKEVAEASSGVAGKTNTVVYSNRLQWLTSTFKDNKAAIGAAAAWLASGTFAYNELNDAISSLGFKANDAIKAGDLQTAEEIGQQMKDLDRFNNYSFVLGGPVSYVFAASQKGSSAVSSTFDAINRKKELDNKDTLIEAKYEAGTATPEEIAEYMTRNPYNVLTTVEKKKQVTEATDVPRDAAGNPLYGAVNENGVYVPSYTEQAKRLEAQQYYNGLTGGNSGTKSEQAPYETPSSLNFGLLKTPGGYQQVKKSDVPEGQSLVTDVNTIADYYFGIPYTQLTPVQKQLVDAMK